jgi:hypothetical protein
MSCYANILEPIVDEFKLEKFDDKLKNKILRELSATLHDLVCP